jgi:hypothetical protein
MSYFKVELSFGHRRQGGELLPQQQVVVAEQQALEHFTQLFQGGQVHRRLGGYMLDDHLILEPCSLIYSVTEAVDGQVAQLWSFASNLAALLDQDCVLVTITPMAGLVGWVQPKPV